MSECVYIYIYIWLNESMCVYMCIGVRMYIYIIYIYRLTFMHAYACVLQTVCGMPLKKGPSVRKKPSP